LIGLKDSTNSAAGGSNPRQAGMGAGHPQRQRLEAQVDALEDLWAADCAARRLRTGFIGRDGGAANLLGESLDDWI